MARLQRMDAHLDTLSNELCQVNTRVGRMAQRQAVMGGFVASLTPPPETFEDEDEDDDDDDGTASDDEDDGDASSSSADTMST